MSYRTKHIYTRVEIDWSEFSDEELKEEMESRGFFIAKQKIAEPEMQLSAMAVYEEWKLHGNAALGKIIDFMLQSAGRIA